MTARLQLEHAILALACIGFGALAGCYNEEVIGQILRQQDLGSSGAEGDPTATTPTQCESRVDAYVYDATNGCYESDKAPAFCKGADVECKWQGPPVVLTAPDGSTYFLPDSCYDFPKDWTVETASSGKPQCAASATPTCDTPLRVDAYLYDATNGCFTERRVFAFCQQEHTRMCKWMGPPVLITDPNGKTYYLPDSCYSFPEDWKVVTVGSGKPQCAQEPSSACDPSMRIDAYGYDASGGDCHTASQTFAFCQSSIPACKWQGWPIILTAPNGASYYLPDSCYDLPDGWLPQEVQNGRHVCGGNAVAAGTCDASLTVYGYSFDVIKHCYDDHDLVFAYCRTKDTNCEGAGSPVVARAPDGMRYYLPNACHDFPAEWWIQDLSEAMPACGSP